MANKYRTNKIGSKTIDTETERYTVEAEIDSLGYATMHFGASMTLRLGYQELLKLEELLGDCRRYLEDQAIDQAGNEVDSSKINKLRDKDRSTMHDPIDW